MSTPHTDITPAGASNSGLLQANLSALRAVVDAACAGLEQVRGDAAVRLDDTPRGPSASVRTPDGRWVRLHSSRDPVAEAEIAVARLFAGGPPRLVVIAGAGLGYLVDVVERRSPSVRVLLVEPMAEVAAAMLARRDWQALVASGRLLVLSGPAYAGAPEAWRFIRNDTDPPVLVAPVLEREFPAEASKARDVITRVLFGARANAEARRQFAPGYLTNTIRNMPAIARAADVGVLKRALAGVPTIVVAAGPSLDRQVAALQTVGTRAVIIAVDTALRPLLDAGIHPHVAVALDPGAVNARHLTGLRDAQETFLVAEGSLDPAALAAFDGRTFIFSVSDHHPWPWLRSQGLHRGRLRAWGSVLTSAVDLALVAGCNPIIFAGTDLAYPDGHPYCRGTTFEDDWADRVATGEPLDEVWRSVLGSKGAVQVTGCDGDPVETAPHLLAFRDWIVEQSVAAADRRFINTAGHGVLEGGRIEQRSLAEVVESLPDQAWAGPGPIDAAWRSRRPTDIDVRPALDRLLVQATTGPEPGEPLESWLAFGGPGLSREAVAEALRDALAEQTDDGPPRAPGGRPEHFTVPHAPERVSLIREIVQREAAGSLPDLAAVTGSQPPGVVEAIAHAGHLVRALLTTPTSLLGDPDGEERPVSPVAPASRAFPWREDVRAEIRNYEAALADAVAARLASGDNTGGRATGQVEVGAPGALVLGAHDPSTAAAARFCDVCARLGLLADWLSVLAWHGRTSPGGADLRCDLAPAVLRTYSRMKPATTVGPAMSLQVGVRLDGRREILLADTSSLRQSMAEALTGILTAVPDTTALEPDVPVWWPAVSIVFRSADAQAVRFAVAAGGITGLQNETAASRGRLLRAWVNPIRVVGLDLGPCMIGNTCDREHALFAQVNGDRGVRIDAEGHWAFDVPWPRPIAGLVRWGREGAVAWRNAETPYVMWRDRQDGAVREDRPPVRVSLAYPQSDGSIWWTTFSGGLWSWTPGGSWRRLIETPPVMALHASGRHVRLDPRNESSDFQQKPAATDAYVWTDGDTHVECCPLGREGPCWSSSSAGGWTAAAHPYGDQIRLRRDNGAPVLLVCPGPFNLAWAGRSLVVSTLRGHLLVFRDLRDQLDAVDTVR